MYFLSLQLQLQTSDCFVWFWSKIINDEWGNSFPVIDIHHPSIITIVEILTNKKLSSSLQSKVRNMISSIIKYIAVFCFGYLINGINKNREKYEQYFVLLHHGNALDSNK